MTPLRVVLDTNVIVSCLLFPGEMRSWLLPAWQAGHVRPLASRETTAELIRVLCYPKFSLTSDERTMLLADYLPWCETVDVANPPEVPPCRDPFDRPFLQLAVAAQADALVTGDSDLLSLISTFRVPIITPNALRERLMPAGWPDNG